VKPEKTPVSSAVPSGSRRGLKAFIGFALVLAVCYGWMLYDLVVFAVHSDLYSYVLLIPFVSAYLIKLKWRDLDFTSAFERRYAVIPLAAGATLLIGYWLQARRGWTPVADDYFALMTLSLLFFLLADAWVFFGGKNLRKLAFPIAFLFFSVPFPVAMRGRIETFLQHESADVAAAMLRLSGMPVLQEGTYFRLPGLRLDVAPECSGIRSSIILFITGLVAANLILNSNWRRVVLVAAMVPLALLRNGFRIFTISQLCVHIGPQMIESPIHRRGGPVFFGLSMIPFLFLLIYLRKKELQTAPKQPLANE
jgi:exosortase C (VPDSG-CTERM-specific)